MDRLHRRIVEEHDENKIWGNAEGAEHVLVKNQGKA